MNTAFNFFVAYPRNVQFVQLYSRAWCWPTLLLCLLSYYVISFMFLYFNFSNLFLTRRPLSKQGRPTGIWITGSTSFAPGAGVIFFKSMFSFVKKNVGKRGLIWGFIRLALFTGILTWSSFADSTSSLTSIFSSQYAPDGSRMRMIIASCLLYVNWPMS